MLSRKEQDLARRALSLVRRDSDFTFLIKEAGYILETLISNESGDVKSQDEWIRSHPIAQLLAYKLKNFLCQNPDNSFWRSERLVEKLAGVDDDEATISTSSLPVDSASHTRGNPLSPLDNAKYQRLIQSRKRLRS